MPMNMLLKLVPEAYTNGTLANPAIALPSRVLPVPGGPWTRGCPRGAVAAGVAELFEPLEQGERFLGRIDDLGLAADVVKGDVVLAGVDDVLGPLARNQKMAMNWISTMPTNMAGRRWR